MNDRPEIEPTWMLAGLIAAVGLSGVLVGILLSLLTWWVT